MPLHLIKLSVGIASILELEEWIGRRAAQQKAQGDSVLSFHTTRMTPKRAEELLTGGSIYWVIKGQIAARQTLLDLHPVTKEGIPHCRLVLEPLLVPVAPRPYRPFQGWRYFTDPPPDLLFGETPLPEELRRELSDLGLL